MRAVSTKICLSAIFLLMASIPVFAVDCKSIRSVYLKERHRCIGLFREAYAPEKQPMKGSIEFNEKNVNDCFNDLMLTYPEFYNSGKCKVGEGENIAQKFEGYAKKCLHQNDFSECDNILNNVKSVDNIRNGDGATLLMIAAQEGDIKALDFLLQKGASAKKVNHNAKNLLHYAVSPITKKFDVVNDTNEVILNVVKKGIELGVHPQEIDMFGWTSLCDAIFHDLSSDVIELLLKAGGNVNLGCPDSPLSMALNNDNTDAVVKLIKAGANVNEKSSEGFPLEIAILHNNYEVVEELIKAKVNVNEKLADGTTMLELAEKYPCGKLELSDKQIECKEYSRDIEAYAYGYEYDPESYEPYESYSPYNKMAELLKKAGAIKPFRGNFIGYCFQSELTEKMVNDAIKQGANVNETDSIGWTPLHMVAQEGRNPKAMVALIKKGAFVNAMTKTGFTPLLSAAFFNPNPAFAKTLINAGADINEQSSLGMPLEVAIKRNNYEVVKALVDAGADLNATVRYLKMSMLELAEWYAERKLDCDRDYEKGCDAQVSKDEIVVLLKKAGAIKPFRGNFIGYCLQPDLTEKMIYDAIKQGADVNESDSVGWTPLHVVAQEGKNPKIMMALIKKGSFVNAMTKTGFTPLLSAAKYNPNPAFIKMLINAGADIYAVDPDSKWGALEYAVAVNSPEVVSFLLKTKLGNNLEDAYKNWLVRIAVTNNPNPNVLVTLFKNGFNARPVGSGYSMKNPLYAALEKKKDAEIVKVLLKNGGVVDDKCMRLARDLPMDTPEERKYRNQMIDLLTRHKK